MNIKKILSTLILLGFFAIVALPLLSLPPSFSPPAWGKTVVFKILLSVLIFLFFWLILQKGKPLNPRNLVNRKSPVFLPLLLLFALFGIYLLATIFSLDRGFSFWGDPERSWGSLNFSFYIVFALLAFLFLKAQEWKRLWLFVFIVASTVSFIAFFQYLELFSETLIPQGDRPAGTLGNSILLAIFLTPLSLLAFASVFQRHGTRRYFFIVLFGILVAALFLSASRAGFIGFGMGILFFLFFFPGRPLLKKIALVLALVGIGIIGFINSVPEPPQFLGEKGVISENWSRLQFHTLQDSRLIGWQIVMNAVGDRPILGYGPYNASIGFDQCYLL